MKNSPEEKENITNQFVMISTVSFSLLNGSMYMIDAYFEIIFATCMYVILISYFKDYFGVRDLLNNSKWF